MSHKPDWIRTATDFGPPLIFGLTYFITKDFMQATVAIVIASAIALTAAWLIQRRFALLPALAAGAAILFGALTLYFQDETILKLKVTIMNSLLASVLLIGLMLNKLPLKMLIGDFLTMLDKDWRTISLRYGLFFATVAIVNEVIWRTQTEAFWVSFRTTLPVVGVVFALLHTPFVMKAIEAYRQANPEPEEGTEQENASS